MRCFPASEVRLSCVTPVESVAGRSIVTIEAIAEDMVGRRVVEAWVTRQVPQCGYCQSGSVMAATALLKQTPKPGDEDIAGAGGIRTWSGCSNFH